MFPLAVALVCVVLVRQRLQTGLAVCAAGGEHAGGDPGVLLCVSEPGGSDCSGGQ